MITPAINLVIAKKKVFQAREGMTIKTILTKLKINRKFDEIITNDLQAVTTGPSMGTFSYDISNNLADSHSVLTKSNARFRSNGWSQTDSHWLPTSTAVLPKMSEIFGTGITTDGNSQNYGQVKYALISVMKIHLKAHIGADTSWRTT